MLRQLFFLGCLVHERAAMIDGGLPGQTSRHCETIFDK